MWLTGFFLTASALLLLLPASALAQPIVWYVDGVNGNDANHCQAAQAACKTIGHAISLASSGDSIIVAPAIYTENLTISFSLNIIGSGAATTVIDGGGVSRVIAISGGNVTLSGLTIRNGAVTFNSGIGAEMFGAGIFNNGNLW
jgi:nitrous oxidase accessory protein NosD